MAAGSWSRASRTGWPHRPLTLSDRPPPVERARNNRCPARPPRGDAEVVRIVVAIGDQAVNADRIGLRRYLPSCADRCAFTCVLSRYPISSAGLCSASAASRRQTTPRRVQRPTCCRRSSPIVCGRKVMSAPPHFSMWMIPVTTRRGRRPLALSAGPSADAALSPPTPRRNIRTTIPTSPSPFGRSVNPAGDVI